MNFETLSPDVAKEVITIIMYCNKMIQKKIPGIVIKKISKIASDSNKEIHLDLSKPLKEQHFSEDALDFFSALYVMYVNNNLE